MHCFQGFSCLGQDVDVILQVISHKRAFRTPLFRCAIFQVFHLDVILVLLEESAVVADSHDIFMKDLRCQESFQQKPLDCLGIACSLGFDGLHHHTLVCWCSDSVRSPQDSLPASFIGRFHAVVKIAYGTLDADSVLHALRNVLELSTDFQRLPQFRYIYGQCLNFFPVYFDLRRHLHEYSLIVALVFLDFLSKACKLHHDFWL